MATSFLEMFTQQKIETRFNREDGKNRGIGQAKIGLAGYVSAKNFAAGQRGLA